jgi:hypothetical protein
MDENEMTVNDQITDAVTQAAPETAQEESPMANQFSADDIAKARAQEKAKLYPQVEKLQDELAILKKEREERERLEGERAAQRQAREAERAALKKAQQEEEMSFKDLLKTKEQEFAAQLEQERLEREKAFALLDREREFQELQQYRQARLEQERDNIIPELIDLISGNNKDEIEQSIAGLKDRSSRIFDSVAQVQQQSRKDMVGTRATLPASGPLDNDSAQTQFSPEAIANMSAAEYMKHRDKLLGTAGNNRGQGLFG